jgi:hypothetical protein
MIPRFMLLLRRPGFWILAFAVAIRTVTLWQISGCAYFDLELWTFDQINFHRGALALAQGDWNALSGNELYAPLYKYLLGGLYALVSPFTDLRIGAARIVQLGLGVAVAWWIYRLGRHWGGTAAGVLASLLYSAFGQALFYESKLLREFPAAAALTAALWVGRDGPARRRAWLGSALLLSVACQLRPNLMLLVPLFLWRARAAWKGAGSWGLVFALGLLPSLARNAIVLGDTALRGDSLSRAFPTGALSMAVIEPQGPIVLAVANHPSQTAPYCKHGGTTEVPELREYGNTVTPTLGRTLRMVLGCAREHPLDFLKLQIRKLYWTLWDGEVPSNHNVYLWQELAPVLESPLSHVGLFTAFALSALAFPHTRRAVPPFLWAFLGAVLAGVVIAYPAGRVRAPAYPLLMLVSALAAGAAWRILKNGRWKPVALQGALCLGLAWFLWPPEPAWVAKALDMEGGPYTRRSLLLSYDLVNLSVAHLERGRPSDPRQAETWLARGWNRSLEADAAARNHARRSADYVYQRVAETLLGRNRPQEALQAAGRWERLSPFSNGPQVTMARAFLRGGTPEAAEQGRRAAYRAAIRDPDQPKLHSLVALFAARCGAPGEAAQALAKAPGVAASLPSALQQELAAIPPPGDSPLPSGNPDAELTLLRRLYRDDGDLDAHRRLADLYEAQDLSHRSAFHLARLGDEGKGRLDALERVRVTTPVPLP